MKWMTRVRAGYVITLAAGIAIGCVTIGSAAAAPAKPKPKPVTHHYALAASAFAPDNLGDTADDYENTWDPSVLSNTDNGKCFNAGLSLPPSATLKSVTFYYTSGTTDDMSLELNRQNLSNHTSVLLARLITRETSVPVYTHTARKIAKKFSSVKNGTYAYSAGVCPINNATFSGLIITYTQPG